MDFRNNPSAKPFRGIRNNNPFNLRRTAIKWAGKTQGTDKEFETFETIEQGIRAGIIDIVGDIVKDKQDTLNSLFAKFAPPFENDTNAYINYISKVTGAAPTDKLAPGGKVDSMFLYKLAAAIITHENSAKGAALVKPETIRAGVDMAINSPQIRAYIKRSAPGGPGTLNERLNDLSGLIFMAVALFLILYAIMKP